MKLRYSLLFLGAAFAGGVPAAEQEGSWTFSPVMGVSQPSLNILYSGVFRAPFRGRAEIRTDLPDDAQGTVTYPRQDFLFYNPLPEQTIAPEAGLEFRRIYGEKNDFMIGVSSWEITAKSSIKVVFPMQGLPDNEAIYERRGDFSFTQYYVGWQHYFYNRRHRRNLYFTLSLHEIFDVDYKEEDVFSFLGTPSPNSPAGFKRILILHSQATGVLLLQAVVGAEFRMAERFSIGVEGGYALGFRQAPLKGLDQRYDFRIDVGGDRLTLEPTVAPDRSTNNLYYLADDGESREEVRLDFSGWKTLVKFNIEF